MRISSVVLYTSVSVIVSAYAADCSTVHISREKSTVSSQKEKSDFLLATISSMEEKIQNYPKFTNFLDTDKDYVINSIVDAKLAIAENIADLDLFSDLLTLADKFLDAIIDEDENWSKYYYGKATKNAGALKIFLQRKLEEKQSQITDLLSGFNSTPLTGDITLIELEDKIKGTFVNNKRDLMKEFKSIPSYKENISEKMKFYFIDKKGILDFFSDYFNPIFESLTTINSVKSNEIKSQIFGAFKSIFAGNPRGIRVRTLYAIMEPLIIKIKYILQNAKSPVESTDKIGDESTLVMLNWNNIPNLDILCHKFLHNFGTSYYKHIDEYMMLMQFDATLNSIVQGIPGGEANVNEAISLIPSERANIRNKFTQDYEEYIERLTQEQEAFYNKWREKQGSTENSTLSNIDSVLKDTKMPDDLGGGTHQTRFGRFDKSPDAAMRAFGLKDQSEIKYENVKRMYRALALKYHPDKVAKTAENDYIIKVIIESKEILDTTLGK